MFVLTSAENTYLTQCELDLWVLLPSPGCLCHMTRFSSRPSRPCSQRWGRGGPSSSCHGKLTADLLAKQLSMAIAGTRKMCDHSGPDSQARLARRWAGRDRRWPKRPLSPGTPAAFHTRRRCPLLQLLWAPRADVTMSPLYIIKENV